MIFGSRSLVFLLIACACIELAKIFWHITPSDCLQSSCRALHGLCFFSLSFRSWRMCSWIGTICGKRRVKPLESFSRSEVCLPSIFVQIATRSKMNCCSSGLGSGVRGLRFLHTVNLPKLPFCSIGWLGVSRPIFHMPSPVPRATSRSREAPLSAKSHSLWSGENAPRCAIVWPLVVSAAQKKCRREGHSHDESFSPYTANNGWHSLLLGGTLSAVCAQCNYLGVQP